MKIGVFDSGIGGEAVAKVLIEAFPHADILAVNDRPNLPYGSKSPEQIIELTDIAIQPLLGRDIIVIACNTATTLALPTLRDKYMQQKFIGIEPMVKPAAAQTKSGVICVCATPATLASQRYRDLKDTYAKHIKVLEPDCSTWASMIEQDNINEGHIQETILSALDNGTDIVVLGCTHYHWIKDVIERITIGRATVLEPSEAIARQVQELLASN